MISASSDLPVSRQRIVNVQVNGHILERPGELSRFGNAQWAQEMRYAWDMCRTGTSLLRDAHTVTAELWLISPQEPT